MNELDPVLEEVQRRIDQATATGLQFAEELAALAAYCSDPPLVYLPPSAAEAPGSRRRPTF